MSSRTSGLTLFSFDTLKENKRKKYLLLMDTRLCDLRISAMVTTVVTARPRPLSSIMSSVSRNFLLRVRKKLSGRFSRDTWMRRHCSKSAGCAFGADMWEWEEGGGEGNGGLGWCGCGGGD